MIATTFIGVDPAWKTDGNHSGIAVLEGDARHVQLRAFAEGLVSMASVVDFVANHSGADSVVAVDAPLVVKNAKGQRPYFGRCILRVSRVALLEMGRGKQ